MTANNAKIKFARREMPFRRGDRVALGERAGTVGTVMIGNAGIKCGVRWDDGTCGMVLAADLTAMGGDSDRGPGYSGRITEVELLRASLEGGTRGPRRLDSMEEIVAYLRQQAEGRALENDEAGYLRDAADLLAFNMKDGE